MRKRKKGSSSVAQRKLMGYAYACATGKTKNCPKSIRDVAKSFTKKDKEEGLKSLRRFTKTKHANLPERVEEDVVIKFNEFIMMNEKLKEGEDVFKFLYTLKDPEVNGYINELMTTHDEEDKRLCVQDILIEIEDRITDEDFNVVSSELKKWINPRKNIKR